MKKVALHNLGCKVNAYETDAMQQLLEEKGYEIVPFEAGADIYIINTCTVTNIADRKSRQMLHKAKKLNPDAIVVAAGCYVQVSGEKAKADACIDIVVGNNHKKEIVSILEDYLRTHTGGGYMDINTPGVEYETLQIGRTGRNTRAYVKVQDGCNQFCSYCIIPYARGRVRSRKPEDIVDEVRTLAAHGYKEIVLTGIHISSYGMDMQGEDHLTAMLNRIHGIAGIGRIRLGSLEPRLITEPFVKTIAQMEKVCPHFHLSLQSGCDETLRRMNRHYTCAEYLEKCELLRAYYEHPAITTDLITGFPGETEEEFAQTVEFVKKVCFYETHIFKYSKRQGTRAAAMDGQHTERTKAQRSSVLLELNRQNSRAFREYYMGRQQEILMEEELSCQGEVWQVGHTPEYVKVAVKHSQSLENQLVTGTASGFLENDVLKAEEWRPAGADNC